MLRALSLWPGILALFATAPLNCVANAENSKFDPDAEEAQTSRCALPPKRKTFKIPDTCMELSSGLTLSDAEELVYEYAPVLLFHPLELYTMQSADETFADPEKGKIFRVLRNPERFVTHDSKLDQSTLLKSTRDSLEGLHNKDFFFVHEDSDLGYKEPDQTNSYMYGGGYEDLEGRARKSKAPIYYNIIETALNTWTINFYFYYTHNGHANLQSVSSFKGKQASTSFLMHPTAIHEGDWEQMSIMVCRSKNVTQPLAVNYFQHGHPFTTDCTDGQCNFYKDTYHPVGFSALYSHATYPVSSYNMIVKDFTKEIGDIVKNLHFFSDADRTAYLAADKTYRIFLPDQDKKNVVPVRDPTSTTNSSHFWQGFGGRWGNSRGGLFDKLSLTACLNENQTDYVDCPTNAEDPVFGVIMQILGVYEKDDTYIKFASLAKSVGELVLPLASVLRKVGEGPLGPIMKENWNMWVDHEDADVIKVAKDMTEDEYCKRITEPNAVEEKTFKNEDLNFIPHLIGAIVVIICLVIIQAIYLLWYYKETHLILEFDENTGEVLEPSKELWWDFHRDLFVFMFWFMMIVIGGIMFSVTSFDTFEILKKYARPLMDTIPWDQIETILIVLGVIIIFLDTFVCIVLWIPTRSMWNKTVALYYEFKGDEELAEYHRRDPCHLLSRKANNVLIISYCVLLLSYLVSVVVVLIGIGTAGFSFAINESCSAVVGNLNGVCFNVDFLETFGLPLGGVECGADFQEMCNEFAQKRRYVTFWGCLLILFGQFYLVLVAGAAYHRQTTTLPLLGLLPTRKEYLERVEDMKRKTEEGTCSDQNKNLFHQNFQENEIEIENQRTHSEEQETHSDGSGSHHEDAEENP